jgi:hypothetical protein
MALQFSVENESANRRDAGSHLRTAAEPATPMSGPQFWSIFSMHGLSERDFYELPLAFASERQFEPIRLNRPGVGFHLRKVALLRLDPIKLVPDAEFVAGLASGRCAARFVAVSDIRARSP